MRMLLLRWSCILTMLGLFTFHFCEVNRELWESDKYTVLSSEDGILECIKACKMYLSAESPVSPGNGHEQPLSENNRKYVMSHFRWNKFGRKNSKGRDCNNAGYKREDIANYPIFNLFPTNDNQNTQDGNVEEEALNRQDNKRSYSMEHFQWVKPVGKKRRPIKVFPSNAEEESSEIYPTEYRRELPVEFDYPDSNTEEDMDDSMLMESPNKKDRKYEMPNFQWEGPPKGKRYGGFMNPESSQTPLMTLFKNTLIKNGHKKGQ